MKARWGTVSSNNVRLSRGLPQGAPESPVIFTMIMQLVLRDLIKSWITRKLAWRPDDFALTAICCADDVVLVAVSMSAAEVIVTEVKEVGLSVGAQKTHWTSYPKMMDKSIMVDGLAVLWEEVLEFVESKVCLDGNARHAIAHRSAQANKCVAKWRPVLKSSWLPRFLRLNIVKNYNVVGLSLEFECLDDGQGPKRQNCELECEDGGERHRREKATMDGIEPVVETMAQNWPSLDRKGQYERVDGHQRTHAQLGCSCCQDGLTKKSVRRP